MLEDAVVVDVDNQFETPRNADVFDRPGDPVPVTTAAAA